MCGLLDPSGKTLCNLTTSVKLEGSSESDYRNTGLKWNPKQDAHSQEAVVHQV